MFLNLAGHAADALAELVFGKENFHGGILGVLCGEVCLLISFAPAGERTDFQLTSRQPMIRNCLVLGQ